MVGCAGDGDLAAPSPAAGVKFWGMDACQCDTQHARGCGAGGGGSLVLQLSFSMNMHGVVLASVPLWNAYCVWGCVHACLDSCRCIFVARITSVNVSGHAHNPMRSSHVGARSHVACGTRLAQAAGHVFVCMSVVTTHLAVLHDVSAPIYAAPSLVSGRHARFLCICCADRLVC
jgi:hypothetical protein